MLHKPIEINNVGRFQHFIAVGDIAFRKLTLIYAANGQGKTTLCAILRSLQTCDASFIQERMTLGAEAGQQSVKLKIDDKIIEFSTNKWQAEYPNIAIFDEHFINENVYIGNSIDNEQRRSLYNGIIGAEGVKLAQEIEKLKILINENNAAIRDSRKIIDPILPSGMDINQFLALPSDVNVEEKINQKADEIAKLKLTIASREEILEKNTLKTIVLPQLSNSFFQLIDCALENVIIDAEERVRQHINHNNMDNHGEAWLARGVFYTTSDHCPYCVSIAAHSVPGCSAKMYHLFNRFLPDFDLPFTPSECSAIVYHLGG